MTLRDRISVPGVLGLLLGLALILASATLAPASRQFPWLLSAIMITLGAGELIQYFRRGSQGEESDDEERESEEWVDGRAALKLAAGLTIYIILMPYLGFYVSSALFAIGLMWVLGIRRPAVLILVPTVLLVIIYGAFTVQLQVPLPKGLLY